MERVLRGAAVRRRVGEWADDLQHLDDRARPAVRDDQRQRVFVTRLDMDEVDVEAVDLRQKLREGVQPRLEPPEVVFAAPVTRECLHRGELDALRSIRDRLLLGPSRRRDAPTEVLEHLVWKLSPERADRGRGVDRGGHTGTPSYVVRATPSNGLSNERCLGVATNRLRPASVTGSSPTC
jgi:hypothetical protein